MCGFFLVFVWPCAIAKQSSAFTSFKLPLTLTKVKVFNPTHLAAQQELTARGLTQAQLPARGQEQGILVPMGTEKEVQLVHKEN